MSFARLGEIERRLANIVKPGLVTAADYPNARLKVQIGGNTTGWIPWVTGRAGGNRSWAAPEVGEQVLVLSPCGDPAQAYVLPGIFQTSAPANGSSATVAREDYADGAYSQYDRTAHALTANIPSGGSVNLTVGGCTLVLNSSGLTLTGGDIIADGISLKQHIHGGVQTGSGNTGSAIG